MSTTLPVARDDGRRGRDGKGYRAETLDAALALAESIGIRPVRIELPRDACDPLAWLRRAPRGQRRYFASRDGGYELAGVGVAERSSSLTELPTAFVRMPFEPGGAVAVCPAVEVGRDDERGWLVVRRRGQLTTAPREDAVTPAGICTRTPATSPAAWATSVQRALAEIDSGHIDKVVLSTAAHLQLDRAMDPVDALVLLSVAEPASYRFLWEEGPQAFFGASPERLYERRGRSLATEALAGTRRRGDDVASEARFASELIASDKDQREHAWVRDAIVSVLEPLTESALSTHAPNVVAHGKVQHLKTAIAGRLREGVDDATILAALHPTPAVGGAPRKRALALIAELEGRARGAYAAPVGVVDRREGTDRVEFAVGLRSAHLRGRDLTAYVGCGIVAGSDANAEWRELGAKLETVVMPLTRPLASEQPL